MMDRITSRLMLPIFAVCGVLGLASGPAAAQGATAADLIQRSAPEADVRKIFDQFDENNDGRIERTEFRVWIIVAFEMLDKDKDNHLVPSEIPGATAEEFAQADKNGDGRLTAFEFSDSEFMKFDKFDLNQDGFITFDEVLARRR